MRYKIMRYKRTHRLTTDLISYSLHPHVYLSIWKKKSKAHSAYGVVDGIRLDELDCGGSTEASKMATLVIYDYAHIYLFYCGGDRIKPIHLSFIKYQMMTTFAGMLWLVTLIKASVCGEWMSTKIVKCEIHFNNHQRSRYYPPQRKVFNRIM